MHQALGFQQPYRPGVIVILLSEMQTTRRGKVKNLIKITHIISSVV